MMLRHKVDSMLDKLTITSLNKINYSIKLDSTHERFDRFGPIS